MCSFRVKLKKLKKLPFYLDLKNAPFLIVAFRGFFVFSGQLKILHNKNALTLEFLLGLLF